MSDRRAHRQCRISNVVKRAKFGDVAGKLSGIVQRGTNGLWAVVRQGGVGRKRRDNKLPGRHDFCCFHHRCERAMVVRREHARAASCSSAWKKRPLLQGHASLHVPERQPTFFSNHCMYCAVCPCMLFAVSSMPQPPLPHPFLLLRFYLPLCTLQHLQDANSTQEYRAPLLEKPVMLTVAERVRSALRSMMSWSFAPPCERYCTRSASDDADSTAA